MFYVVFQAESATLRDLAEWIKVANDNVNLASATGSLLQRRIEQNARIVSLIQEEALASPEDFRGIRDSRGNLQAGAIVIDMEDHLFVEWLATAPWNVIGEEPRAIKKAATILMAQLARESSRNGHEGQIILNAMPDAIAFYRKIGLVETGGDSPNAPEMQLTAAAAKLLMDRYLLTE